VPIDDRQTQRTRADRVSWLSTTLIEKSEVVLMLKPLLHIVCATLILFACTARAEQGFENFSAERFAALQAEGTTVVIDVWAPWCPTCRNQAPKLAALLAEPAFAGYVGLKLHWDDQREIARSLGAPRQSTVFVFKGSERRAMSVAETDLERLREVYALGLE
jgi:thioredoxin 1